MIKFLKAPLLHLSTFFEKYPDMKKKPCIIELKAIIYITLGAEPTAKSPLTLK